MFFSSGDNVEQSSISLFRPYGLKFGQALGYGVGVWSKRGELKRISSVYDHSQGALDMEFVRQNDVDEVVRMERSKS